MLKRFISLFLCLLLAAFSFCSCDRATEEDAVKYGFGDRILYGGTAVDVEGGTVFSENGRTFFADSLGNEAVLATALRNAEEIKDETLADTLSEGTLTFAKEWNINGEKVTLSVEKV